MVLGMARFPGRVDAPSDHISARRAMNGITADSRIDVQARPELFVAYAESDTEWVHGFLLPAVGLDP